jgi:hypothetical protein
MSSSQRKVLERAKDELRELHGKKPAGRPHPRRAQGPQVYGLK